MKYYILDRDEIKKGNIVVWGVSDTKPTLQDNQFLYETEDGENIPNNWGYDELSDTLIDYGNIPKDKIDDIHTFMLNKKKEKREELIHSNLTYNGNIFQMRFNDISNFEDAYSIMKDTDVIEWITANDTLVNLTKEDINNILTQYKLRKNEIFKEYINKVIKTRR